MLDNQPHPISGLGAWVVVLGRHYGYLRGYVVWGPAESAGSGPREDVLLTHAKVSDFDVSFSIQHHVV